MKALAITSILAILLSGIAFVAFTAAPPAAATEPALDAQVAELLAMPPAERRAQLKALAPEERRELWRQVKQAQRAKQTETKPYRTMTPRVISAETAPSWTRMVGTIVYDSDFPSQSYGGGAIIGNRFDTQEGEPVQLSGTVSTVQAVLVPGPAFANTMLNVGVVITGPQTTGGGAVGLFTSWATATGGIATVTFNALGVNYPGQSFFVLFDDHASNYVPVFGTGTNLGQGHHGVVGYTGGNFPNLTGTFNFGNALNGFVRATGNIVPVELMRFDVE